MHHVDKSRVDQFIQDNGIEVVFLKKSYSSEELQKLYHFLEAKGAEIGEDTDENRDHPLLIDAVKSEDANPYDVDTLDIETIHPNNVNEYFIFMHLSEPEEVSVDQDKYQLWCQCDEPSAYECENTFAVSQQLTGVSVLSVSEYRKRLIEITLLVNDLLNKHKIEGIHFDFDHAVSSIHHPFSISSLTFFYEEREEKGRLSAVPDKDSPYQLSVRVDKESLTLDFERHLLSSAPRFFKAGEAAVDAEAASAKNLPL